MGWRNWFKLSNYSDRVVKSVIATTYAKKKLSIILILLATIIFRIHILTLLCILISTGNFYLDFVQFLFRFLGIEPDKVTVSAPSDIEYFFNK